MNGYLRGFANRYRQSPDILLMAMLFAASILLTALHFTEAPQLTYEHDNFAKPYDHQAYLHAASHPLDCASISQCWRPAIPIFAGLLPLPVQNSFRLLTFTTVSLLGPVLYYFLRLEEFPRGEAILGAGMLYTLPIISFQAYDFWLVDAHALLAVLIVLLAIKTDRKILYVTALTLGVAVKEPVLFCAPLYYTLNPNRSRVINWKLAKQTILFALPAVIMFFGIRHIIGLPADYTSAYPAAFVQILGDTQTDNILNANRPLYRVLWTTWGLVPIFVVMAPRTLIHRCAVYSPFLLFVGYQMTFSTGAERYLPLAVPVIIPVAIVGARSIYTELHKYTAIPREWALLPVIVSFTIIALRLPTHSYKFGVPIVEQLNIFVVSMLIGAVFLIGYSKSLIKTKLRRNWR